MLRKIYAAFAVIHFLGIAACNSPSTIAETQSEIKATIVMGLRTATPKSSLESTFAPTPEPTTTPIGIYPDDENRTIYRTLQVDYWNKKYQEAFDQHAIWLENPQEVALRFLPSTYSEWSTTRQTVYYLPANAGEAIFIVLSGGGDDSIGLVKYRLELAQVEDIWRIEWVGYVHRCIRGDKQLQKYWHTEPCP